MRPIEYRTAHGGSLFTEGLTPYTGPEARQDSQMNILNQRVKRKDGIDTTVGELLTLTEALQSGLVEQSKKIAELEARLRMMQASQSTAGMPDMAVLDSRHGTRVDTDDPDPFERQQARLTRGEHVATKQAPTGHSDAGDDDYDPFVAAQARITRGR